LHTPIESAVLVATTSKSTVHTPAGADRTPATGALFAGSDGGAEHWATVASLIETCKLIGVEPHAYLADVITRIVNGHPQSRLNDLLPWAYPPLSDLKAVA
jgi:hypothetical protein